MSAISKTFGVVSTAAKSTDKFSGAFKALSSLDKVSGTASLLKKLDFKAIAGTFSSVASTTRVTSNIADTASAVKKFSNLVPSSTDEILGSISDGIKQTSNVSSIKSISKIDIDAKFIKAVSESNSLQRLKKISTSISDSAPVASGISRRSTKLLSKTDNLASLAKVSKVSKVEDVAGALKKGKGTLSKLDEVGDAGKFAKKADVADDAADASKKFSKLEGGASFIKKNIGFVNQAILAGYFLGIGLTLLRKSDTSESSGEDPLELITDPASDVFTKALVNEFKEGEIIVGGGESISLADTLKQKEVVIAFIVVISIIAAL